jgi:group I intron endonuclease
MAEQKKIGIYIIISPTDKFYIGQTIDFVRRLMQYQRLHCKEQRHLYNSFVKYGVENHHFIFFYETTVDKLNHCERFCQDMFSWLGKKLMNLKFTGTEDKSGYYSEEMKEKISEAKKGKYTGEKNPFFGKTHSEETKLKMSEANKGEKHYNFGKGKIIQKLDMKTMEVIEEGDYIYFVNRGYNNCNINSVCNGNRKSHKGFFWRYKIEEMQ